MGKRFGGAVVVLYFKLCVVRYVFIGFVRGYEYLKIVTYDGYALI